VERDCHQLRTIGIADADVVVEQHRQRRYRAYALHMLGQFPVAVITQGGDYRGMGRPRHGAGSGEIPYGFLDGTPGYTGHYENAILDLIDDDLHGKPLRFIG